MKVRILNFVCVDMRLIRPVTCPLCLLEHYSVQAQIGKLRGLCARCRETVTRCRKARRTRLAGRREIAGASMTTDRRF